MVLAACGGGGSSSPSEPTTLISVQPADQSAAFGAAAVFVVTATGNGLSYQWQQSTDAGSTWTDLAGATSPRYAISAVTSSMNGSRFRVVVKGSATSVTSSSVGLTVTSSEVAPGITVQPFDQTVPAGQDASFAVTASGTALQYLWQRSADGVNWKDLSGQTQVTLVWSTAAIDDNGTYVRVVVGNILGSQASSAVKLTVLPAPVVPQITGTPQDVALVAPAAAVFTVRANGTSPLSYQWQQSTDGAITFTDIAQATSASLTIPATTTAMSGMQYRVRVANSAGSAWSAPVILMVLPAHVAPNITSQPSAVRVSIGETANFSVATSGTTPMSYQWQVSTDSGATFANINGATSATYTTPATVAADSGRIYRVMISNDAGIISSNMADLTVLVASAPPTISGPPSAVTVLSGSTATFSVEATSSSRISYQWQVSTDNGYTFANIPGATGTSYTTSVGSASDNWQLYRVLLSNNAGTNISRAASLTVGPPTSLTLIAGNVTERGSADGTGAAARFNAALGIGVDKAGNLFVVDANNFSVRKITPPNVVSTFLATNAGRLAINGVGNLIVSEGSALHKMTPDGTLTTLAGTANVSGSTDGIGSVALFGDLLGVAIDSAGNIYTADIGNHTIRKITPAGVVTTLAGLAGNRGYVDGIGSAARFNSPAGIAVDNLGNVFVTEGASCVIRKITPAGVVTTLAGTAGTCGIGVDGIGATAQFDSPTDLAVDASGNIYVADRFSIRKISPAGAVATVAGFFDDGSYTPGGTQFGWGTSSPEPVQSIAMLGRTMYFTTWSAVGVIYNVP